MPTAETNPVESPLLVKAGTRTTAGTIRSLGLPEAEMPMMLEGSLSATSLTTPL
ncbi:MAG: hypothetical protein AABX69_03465 [Nanoarchaeota archaeon]